MTSVVPTVLLVAFALTLGSCRSRFASGPAQHQSESQEAGASGLHSLDLLSPSGREALATLGDVVGAVYIGRVSLFQRNGRIASDNASFAETKALEKVVSDLRRAAGQPAAQDQITSANAPEGLFRFVGCKPSPMRATWDTFQALWSADKSPLKDALIPNYTKVWQTGALESPGTHPSCATALLAKDRFELTFLLRPDAPSSDSTSSAPSGSTRQLVLVSAGPQSQPAVFESRYNIPKGKVLTVVRHDAWGQARPGLALLPSEESFSDNEQKDALAALGWRNWGVALRRNAVVDVLLRGHPTTLMDLSARFGAFLHYAAIGGAVLQAAEMAVVPAGAFMAAAATPAAVAAVYTAMTTHALSASTIAPLVAFSAGATAAGKALCDVSDVKTRAVLDTPGGAWQRARIYCFVVNVAFGVTTAVQATASLPMVRQAWLGSLESSVAAAMPANLDLGNSVIRAEAQELMVQFARDAEAQLEMMSLGLTNLPAAGYAQASIAQSALQNLGELREASAKIIKLDAAVSAWRAFRGLSYGLSFAERARLGCPNLVDLQRLRLGQVLLPRLNWEGCFALLRRAYVGPPDQEASQKDPRQSSIAKDDGFWMAWAARKKLRASPSHNQNQTPPAYEVDFEELSTRETNLRAQGASLQNAMTGPDGPEILRAPSLTPWNEPSQASAALKRMSEALQSDITRCGETMAKASQLEPFCKNASGDCLYRCAVSALHRLRNEYWPVDYLVCVTATPQTEAPESCTVAFDAAADDGTAMLLALTKN